MRNQPSTMSSSSSLKSPNAKKKTKKRRKQYVPKSFLECQSITHVLGFPPQNELVTTPVASEFAKELFLDRFVKEIVNPFQPDKTKNRHNGSNNGTPTTESNAGYYHVMVAGKLVKKRTITPPVFSKPTDEIDSSLTRKRRIWKENIVIGTNQCLRLLETVYASRCGDTTTTTPTKAASAMATTNASDNSHGFRKPFLIVLAKDIYPPTMCCAVPVLAKHLEVPLLILPGKASLELGRALNSKRTSILLFRSEDDGAAPTNNGSEASSRDRLYEKESRGARTAMESFVSFVREHIPRNIN